MARDIKEIRRSYRHGMRSHAKATGRDQAANVEKGLAFINAVHAAGLAIGHVSWFERPIIVLEDGFLIQSLRTGGIAVHAKAVTGGFAGAQHHKAHPARTPEDAIRLLKGPVARLSAAARILCRKADQEDTDKTALFRSAIDQIAVGNRDHDAAGRLATGLALLGLLDERGIQVRSVTVEHRGIVIGLPQGSVTQEFEGGFVVGYAVRDGDGTYDYGLDDGRTGSPEDAVRLYVERAVPKSEEQEAERRREREERRAHHDAEAARQADIVARFEALTPDERLIALLGVEYLDVAMRRAAGPIGLLALPSVHMRGGLPSLFESIEDGEFPVRRRAPSEEMPSDVFAGA